MYSKLLYDPIGCRGVAPQRRSLFCGRVGVIIRRESDGSARGMDRDSHYVTCVVALREHLVHKTVNHSSA
ncbi:hypothetical protein PTE30175_05160 [Pandoraea terrae]|uniref:Uncharacterized protein n=1 Tax=Pandoraea terrae TaxID=1537710 RepID=A0A5E4ZCG1_9BURK|nr:hypothetical protein PTE30175_05160 [Pandoraea terrae]